MTTVATLLTACSDPSPLAAAEMYTDPPELAPLPKRSR